MKLILIIATCFALNAFAGPDHDMPAPKISANFESLKALVGTWEGTNKMHGKEEKVKVTYELTSGGTAIIEKMMPGTPHEMVSVYSNNGEQVHMTHYCMLGNQPQMKLKRVDGSSFAFEMDGTKGIANKKEMHMHALVITLNGNKLKEEWTNYKDNKKGEMAIFEYTKKN